MCQGLGGDTQLLKDTPRELDRQYGCSLSDSAHWVVLYVEETLPFDFVIYKNPFILSVKY